MDPADHTTAAVDDAGPAATPEDKTITTATTTTCTTTVVSPTAARSYECTFCKRGFSNAQALGGHMNIHRKDRAKLQQAPALQPTAHQFPFAVGYTTVPWAAAAASPSRNPRQLQPLFVDGPSSRREVKEDRKMEHGPEELDLELRLGPDAAAGPATGLKEFV